MLGSLAVACGFSYVGIFGGDSNIGGRVIMTFFGLLFLLPFGLAVWALARDRGNAIFLHEHGLMMRNAGTESRIRWDDIATYDSGLFLSIGTKKRRVVRFRNGQPSRSKRRGGHAARRGHDQAPRAGVAGHVTRRESRRVHEWCAGGRRSELESGARAEWNGRRCRLRAGCGWRDADGHGEFEPIGGFGGAPFPGARSPIAASRRRRSAWERRCSR